jgi:hypothetical protein
MGNLLAAQGPRRPNLMFGGSGGGGGWIDGGGGIAPGTISPDSPDNFNSSLNPGASLNVATVPAPDDEPGA